MRLPRRAEVARFLAPAAFLLVVTIAVLLVRSGLEGGGGSGATTPLTALVTERTTTTTRSTTTTPKPAARRFYTIQSGGRLVGRWATLPGPGMLQSETLTFLKALDEEE